MDNQKLIDKEKESFKLKYKELEDKNKALEKQRQSQLFEIENEKNKFNCDKNVLLEAKQDLLDKNESLEKRKDQLLKENEQLKQKIKANKPAGKDWASGRPMAGTGFADHLLRSTKMKENGESQVFSGGMLNKWSQMKKEGSTTSSDKRDVQQMPLAYQDSNKLYPQGSTTTPNLGSPVPQRQPSETDTTQ